LFATVRYATIRWAQSQDSFLSTILPLSLLCEPDPGLGRIIHALRKPIGEHAPAKAWRN
jgi:hypothetical protein